MSGVSGIPPGEEEQPAAKSERITTHTLRNLDHMFVLYPTPMTSTMNYLDISSCSLNRFAHSDCTIVGIPLQITPHSMRYVVSPDAFHLPLHLLNHGKSQEFVRGSLG